MHVNLNSITYYDDEKPALFGQALCYYSFPGKYVFLSITWNSRLIKSLISAVGLHLSFSRLLIFESP